MTKTIFSKIYVLYVQAILIVKFVGSEIQQQQLSNSVPGGLNQHLNSYIE